MITILLQTPSSILVVFSLIVAIYYWILALTTLFNRKEKYKIAHDYSLRIAIVIPAHNEEKNIAATIESCEQLRYPSEMLDIFVIADNCSDRTAEIAGNYKATLLERRNQHKRGKGFALAWAFEKILPRGHDAYLVIDADCSLDRDALARISFQMQKGAEVIQINYKTANPDDSPMTYALAVGSYIENELFYAPKSTLGLAVFLRGTGMVFRRRILKTYPWHAFSNAEDMEYGLKLLDNGIRIEFLRDTKVISPFPATIEQLRVQRSRWATGNLSFGRKQALRLIIKGIISRNLTQADTGLTFLVLSRPLVLLTLFLGMGGAFATKSIVPGAFSSFLAGAAVLPAAMLVIYFLLGIWMVGITWRRAAFLLSVPATIGRLTIISLKALLAGKDGEWKRTPR